MSRTLALTEELITLSSVTPEDKGCQARMAELLQPLGFNCETIQSGAVTNLWARRGTAQPLLVFAGHTDVISAWDDPKKTLLYNSLIPLHIMESIKNFSDEIFFFQSSSSLMYSNSNEHIINENSKYSPLYPYGISKLQTHLLLNEYRKKYNLKCSSGIFFNHDSYYRNEKFLSKKVAKFVVAILNGKDEKLNLGNLNSYRDISHADDFMLGVEMIINNKINEDFIFSSGVSTKILDFVKLFFDFTNLDFEKYVTFEKKLIRDSDYNIIGDNSKLKSFGWVNNYDIKSLVSNMIQDEIENYKNIDTLT